MNDLLDRIVTVRRQVSPRTSYATSGAAASTILIVGNDVGLVRHMGEGLLRTGEFDKYEHMEDIHEGNMMKIQGHVVVFVNPVTLIVHRLLEQKRTNLAFISIATNNNEVLTAIQRASTAVTNVKTVTDEFASIATKLITFYANNQSSSSSGSGRGDNNRSAEMPTTFGFNQQPSVQSRQQFAFLWNGAKTNTTATPTSSSSSSSSSSFRSQSSSSHPSMNHPMSPALDAKLRVLQRLADRELLDKSKWSVEKWDDTIASLLAQGADDYGVYSMLRERYLGKTLEESLRIDLDQPSTHLSKTTATTTTNSNNNNNNKSEVSGGGNGAIEEESPDGRAGTPPFNITQLLTRLTDTPLHPRLNGGFECGMHSSQHSLTHSLTLSSPSPPSSLFNSIFLICRLHGGFDCGMNAFFSTHALSLPSPPPPPLSLSPSLSLPLSLSLSLP